MSTPSEKLAESLKALQKLQRGGRRVFKSNELSRTHRERLLQNGFIQEVMKGWLISTSPSTKQGDSTPWYASFWEFCARYCNDRFEDQWYLSPEHSLLIHAEKGTIPNQVIIYSPKGTNNTLELPFDTSLYDVKQLQMASSDDLMVREELRLYSPIASLTKVSEAFFVRNPVETQVVLAGIPDASDVLRRLLSKGHSVVAGRLAGAFRRIGRDDITTEIIAAMKASGYDVRETDPFAPKQSFGPVHAVVAPIVGRLQTIWNSMRATVIKSFPKPPGLPKDRAAYLQLVDEIYESDAYHSLSIEGYHVSHELVERVSSGAWNPERHDEDRRNRDALAARGYWQAFQAVKSTVMDVISGTNPGTLARTAHRDWYRALFQPCVAVGLLSSSALAGYRNNAVYIRGSRYVPPRWEAVRDAMPALFELLEKESEPCVRAVLGHWLFGYIHPYSDGNGRMARFLMNVALASGGYPWTVIRADDRTVYLEALDRASIDMDIEPFAKFIAEQVLSSLK